MCCSTASWKRLSKSGSFVGQHIYTPLQGAAVHINAFNFPVWGMLEKLAPTLLAGVPAIVKPASATALSVRSGVPDHDRQRPAAAGARPADRRRRRRPVRPSDRAGRGQLHRLRARPRPSSRPTRWCMRESVRFVAEQDSLNASLLGPDAAPGTPEFDLFVKEVGERDDGQGGPEMHRHPPRHGAGRASRRGRGRDRRTAGQDQRRRPARRGQPHGRAGQHRASATTSAARSPSWSQRARGSSRAIPTPRRRSRRRLPAAGAAPHRRSVEHRSRSTTSRRSGRSRRSCPTATSPTPSRSPIAAWAACALSLFTHVGRRRARFRPGRRRLPRPHAGHQPRQCRRIHRPRLAAARPGPRRARPRRRQRGDGRRARRQTLHAAHRDPVDPGDDRRDHRAIYPRRAQARDRRPPVPQDA